MNAIRWFADLGRDDLEEVGGKAANLGELVGAGLPVPPGFVITTAAYRDFVERAGLQDAIIELARRSDDPVVAAAQIHDHFRSAEIDDDLRAQILGAYGALGSTPAVAVRSSATAEDLAEASFAGQQDTYLNVVGADELLVAVRDCWASLWTGRAIAYRERQGIGPESVALAVVVQQMIEAETAGVMFTANPANGRRDETVISAAWGLGESVVSGGVDTDDLVINSEQHRIVSRSTADKQVMTVYVEHGTAEVPVPDERRRAEVLADDVALALARTGAAVQDHFGRPQDIEWARVDDQLFLVQARPITALPEPEGPVPTDWTVPDPTAMYVRASIVEQLPDPLSTLFAELEDGAVTRALQKLFGEVAGAGAVRDDDVALPTVNGYAYYRYSRRGMARLLLRTPQALRVLSPNGPHFGINRWRDRARPGYHAVVDRWTAQPLDALTADELMTGVVELLDAGNEYYTAVQTIIPMAATGEIVFTQFYDKLVKRSGDASAQTFLLGFDSAPIAADKSLWDLARWIHDHDQLEAFVLGRTSGAVVDAVRDDGPPAGVDDAGWAEWTRRFHDHLARHGHTVYNLDFVVPVPADEPSPVVDALRFSLGPDAKDPYERQRLTAERRDRATASVRARLDPVRRAMFDRLLRAAQSVGPLREDALADVGLAWPRLRAHVLELGRRLVERDVVADPADAFWLRRVEILGALAEQSPRSLQPIVGQRRMQWRGRRRAIPPQILPKGTWMESMRHVMPAASEEQTGDMIRGIAGSSGQVTGPARVLGGPADFGLLQPGDVLVAGITTPAWTSLFAVASGVVTDVGGPLSHSSIVAREYGIPAVLGTGVATRWATDGESITVDGDRGTVTRAGDSRPATSEVSTTADRLATRRAVEIGASVGAGVAVGAAVFRRIRRRRSATS